jgi:histidyl-tRNA synthetase
MILKILNKLLVLMFYRQCDIDFAGEYEPMLTDTECVKLVCDILKELDMHNFTVKVSNVTTKQFLSRKVS